MGNLRVPSWAAIFASKCHFSSSFSFRDKTLFFFLHFQRFYVQNKLPSLHWGAVSVLSGAATVASKYDFSSSYSFRNVFFMIFKHFTKLRWEKNLSLKPILVYWEGWGYSQWLGVQMRLFKCFQFPRCDVFFDMFKIFSKQVKFPVKQVKFPILQHYVWVLPV